jgi:amidase
MSDGLLQQLTSVEVTEAFLVSAAVAQQATGCLSEFFPEEARARARELDAKQARGEALGVLHGLPVSVKVKGGREQ